MIRLGSLNANEKNRESLNKFTVGTKKVCYNVTNLSPQSSMTHCRVRPTEKPRHMFDWRKSRIFKEL